MSRFYGLRPNDIDEMPIGLYFSYLKSIDRLKAEDALISLEVFSFPKIKEPRDRDKILKKYGRAADPDYLENGITFKEFARKQNNGIGSSRD